MPTIARIGPYRMYLYSHDRAEPPHVHVDRDAYTVKFWLAPVEVAYNIGFRPKELRDIQADRTRASDEFPGDLA